MSSGRIRRVDEAMRAVLGDAISKDLRDPRVGFVTVTQVKTSPDLRHARVFVSVLGDEAARVDSLAGLQSAHGYLQARVASELRLKHTPTLTFQYDDSVDRGMRISELIDTLTGRRRVPDQRRGDQTAGARNDTPEAAHGADDD
jgi:ribosome-binding factor A